MAEILTLADGITDAKWAAQTTVLCHWCCHSFTSIPMKLPYKKAKDGRLRVHSGPFCSLNCAKASAKRANVDPGLLHLLWKSIDPSTHAFAHRILSAPPWQSLKIFGGPLTIDEFRDGFVMFPMTRAPPRVPNSPVFSRRNLILLHSDRNLHVELLHKNTHVDVTRLCLTRKAGDADEHRKYKRSKRECTPLDVFLANA